MEGKFIYSRLVLLLMFGFVLADFQGYKRPYYMDEEQSPSRKNTINLTPETRAVVIRASRNPTHHEIRVEAKCNIIAPLGYELTVSVINLDIPKESKECNDYLEIEGVEGKPYEEKICGRKEEQLRTSYTSNNKLEITFKVGKPSLQRLWSLGNFLLVVTASRKESDCSPPKFFQCGNKKCLPLIYRCDGLTNCGDQSDEFDCAKFKAEKDRKEPGMSGLFVTLLTFGGVVLSILFIAVIIYNCGKRPRPGLTEETTSVATVSRLERQLSSGQSYASIRPVSPIDANNQPNYPYYVGNPASQSYQSMYGAEATAPPPTYDEATLRK